jgi:hypothetical protein
VFAHLDQNALGFAHLRDARWPRVFRRALAILDRVAEQRSRTVRQHPPRGSQQERIVTAALVADYHSWKWADEESKDSGRYPTRDMLLKAWSIDNFDLGNALVRVKYRSWEHMHVDDESDQARLAILKRAAMRNVREQSQIEAKDRNPAHLRVAAELIGAGKAAVQIHNGNVNTVNVVLPSQAELDSRFKRLQEVQRSLPVPTEVPVESLGFEVARHAEVVPRAEDRSTPEDGAPDSQRDRGAP